jgi:hypothetical protein
MKETLMNMIRKSVISLGLILLSTPVISGQDLSRYRKFVLGASLAAISKQVGKDESQATLISQSPALIQQMTYWQIDTSDNLGRMEPISHITLDFYNGALYRIVVVYDEKAVEGLTEEDMVKAISARYGNGVRLYPEIDFPNHDAYSSQEKVIAQWDDSQNSVSFFHSTGSESFGLAVFSKQVNAQAEAAIVESARLAKEQAPQKEIDRQKKEVDDLDVAREKNIKSFRP